MNFDNLKSAVAAAAALRGLTEYELYYMSDSSTSVETLKDEISSFSSGVSGGICFRCLFRGKMGYASTELMEESEMEALVDRAVENAEATEKEDTVGIFAGSPSYERTNAPAFAPMNAADLKALALSIQAENYKASEKVADGTQSYAMSAGVNVRLVNSHGLDLSNAYGLNIVYSEAVVRDGDNSENNFEFEEVKDGFDAAEFAKKAVRGAEEMLGAGTVASGKYDMVISADAMTSLLSAFSSVFSAKNAQLGLSMLAGKEGEKIAADIVNITDDPMREGLPAQTFFDAEGVAARRKSVVEAGVLKTLLHNRETAEKAGVESTGNASKGGYSAPVAISPYAFFIEPGETSEKELLALAGNGIFIKSFSGLHAGADAVTGDFSLQSEGFVLEGGKKTRAVKTFTVAGNFYNLLKDIAAVGNRTEHGVPGGLTVFGAPAVLVRGMSVAGKDND